MWLGSCLSGASAAFATDCNRETEDNMAIPDMVQEIRDLHTLLHEQSNNILFKLEAMLEREKSVRQEHSTTERYKEVLAA
jgi:hypothetical protein